MDALSIPFVLSTPVPDREGVLCKISPGALAAFKKHPIALWNHDEERVIGRWTHLRLREDGSLVGRLQPLQDLAVHQPYIHSLLVNKMPLGASISAATYTAEYPEDQPGVTVWHIEDLLEVSVVSTPGNHECYRSDL